MLFFLQISILLLISVFLCQFIAGLVPLILHFLKKNTRYNFTSGYNQSSHKKFIYQITKWFSTFYLAYSQNYGVKMLENQIFSSQKSIVIFRNNSTRNYRIDSIKWSCDQFYNRFHVFVSRLKI